MILMRMIIPQSRRTNAMVFDAFTSGEIDAQNDEKTFRLVKAIKLMKEILTDELDIPDRGGIG